MEGLPVPSGVPSEATSGRGQIGVQRGMCCFLTFRLLIGVSGLVETSQNSKAVVSMQESTRSSLSKYSITCPELWSLSVADIPTQQVYWGMDCRENGRLDPSATKVSSSEKLPNSVSQEYSISYVWPATRLSVPQASSAEWLCTESGSSSPDPYSERSTIGSPLHRLEPPCVVSFGSFQSAPWTHLPMSPGSEFEPTYSRSAHLSQEPSLLESQPWPSLESESHHVRSS